MKVQAVMGDITAQNCDAIITLANPDGDWYGGVDYAIKDQWGQIFHSQLKTHWQEGNFKNGDIVIAVSADYPAVIFVCDDYRHPLALSTLVKNALIVAHGNGYHSLSMPVFRSGNVKGLFDQSQVEAALVQTLLESEFSGDHTIVVYQNPDQLARIQKLIAAG